MASNVSLSSNIATAAIFVSNYISGLWHFIFSSTSTPNWVLGFLILVSAIALSKLARNILRPVDGLHQNVINWHDYTTDNFFNTIWRWNYRTDKITDLSPFCSHCDFRVFPQSNDMYDSSISLSCGNCSTLLKRFEKSYDQVERDVMLKIDHNLRTGKWKDIVEPNQESKKLKLEQL